VDDVAAWRDGVDHAATPGRLDEKPCVTRNLNVHGFHRQAANFDPARVRLRCC
jgi:hypothetical protein